MARWEYSKLDLNDAPRRGDDMDLLDNAGSNGWELVAVTNTGVAYIKRQVLDAAKSRRRGSGE
jgi:hypothetical protein